MIKINDKQFLTEHFPDGTQCLTKFDFSVNNEGSFDIFWKYSNDEELISLIYIVNHIRNGYTPKDVKINLYMPYVPNARMDRVKKPTEIFTLKYFCNLINGLNFDKVIILDPHSDVSAGLLNRVKIADVNEVIKYPVRDESAIANRWDKELMIFFPDAGAYKRYKDLDCVKEFRKIYGNKVRDWNTGKILGLNIVDENGEKLPDDALNDKDILMIDDIISYGGTLYYSALKINELGANRIVAYATHVEGDSLWDKDKGTFRKCLEDGSSDTSNKDALVTLLYTTNSLYKYESGNRVYVLNIETLK